MLTDLATRLDVEFTAGDLTLRGWLHLPAGRGPDDRVPGIAMAHGFSGIKEHFDGHDFPRRFRDAGFAVLVYDHRNCGDSDGTPRNELDPLAQQRDLRHALTFLGSRPEVDPDRLGVWGSSYSGGHALAVAALDSRVRCVVVQSPTISGSMSMVRRHTPARLAALDAEFAAERRARQDGAPPRYVPLSDDSGQESFLADPEVAAFFAALPPEALARSIREITLLSWEMYRDYEPGLLVERIAPTPLLVLVQTRDTITAPDDALAAFARAGEPKRLVLADTGHYGMYTSQFPRFAQEAVDWFTAHLGPRVPAARSTTTAGPGAETADPAG